MEKKTRKRYIVGIIVVLAMLIGLIIVVMGSKKSDTQSVKIEDIVYSAADYQVYEYHEMKENADVIAMIEVVDSVEEGESEIDYYDKYITSYCGLRKAVVRKFYKNDTNSNEDIRIYEPAAVVETTLMCDEGYRPLEKGHNYLVYLVQVEDNKYSIMGGGESVIDLADVDNSKNAKIAHLAIIDIGTEEFQEKNMVVSALVKNISIVQTTDDFVNSKKVDAKIEKYTYTYEVYVDGDKVNLWKE